MGPFQHFLPFQTIFLPGRFLSMNLADAHSQIADLQHLIDRRYQGMAIDEIIPAPTEEREMATFTDRYMQSYDAEFALEPFRDSDLKLLAVLDRYHIREYGFFYKVDVDTLRATEGFDLQP